MGFYIQIDVKAITKLFHIDNRRMRFEIQIDELISTGIFKLFYCDLPRVMPSNL